MAKIFVSVPVMNRPELRMINSLYVSIFHSKHQVQPYFNEQDSLISRARNIHLYKFLYEYPDCDYFVSIDSDLEILNCSAGNNIFDKLVEHDKDFVGGLYASKGDPIVCSSIPYEAKRPIFNSGLLRMRWLSSGCWCLKRSAVEKLVKAYPELDYDGDGVSKGNKLHGLYIPYLYDVKKEDFPNIESRLPYKKYLSEDWAFPVDPDTNILCDGFRWKRIKDIKVGEAVISFEENPERGYKRRMKTGIVLDKINKILPRYKIITEDGEVITTADHQWLIKRSWRLKGRKGRKNGNRMVHPSKSYWAKTEEIRKGDDIYYPIDCIDNVSIGTHDYRVGYLKGMWDGDGTICKSKEWNSWSVILRVTDKEIIDRVAEFLSCEGMGYSKQKNINEKYASFNKDKHKLLQSIRVAGKDCEKFMSVLNINIENDEYRKGYMAGIFDAEGHYDGASISLCQCKNIHPVIWGKIKDILVDTGFNPKSNNKGHTITGVYNVHKFFMMTSPAVHRKMHLKGQYKGKGNLIMPQRKSKVVNIEKMSEGKVICLTTETATFIANGFASHNCSRWLGINGDIYADTSLVLKHIGKRDFNMFDVKTEGVNDR